MRQTPAQPIRYRKRCCADDSEHTPDVSFHGCWAWRQRGKAATNAAQSQVGSERGTRRKCVFVAVRRETNKGLLTGGLAITPSVAGWMEALKGPAGPV